MADRISIDVVGRGAAVFEGRIRALERNLGEIPLAAAATMRALERYNESHWGAGVKDSEETDVRWPEHSPLYNTGKLKDSLTHAGSVGAIREILPSGFRFGTDLAYARILASGWMAQGTTWVDPKPVIPSMHALRAIAGAAMRQYILKGSGLGSGLGTLSEH